jgi:hypothetical protein
VVHLVTQAAKKSSAAKKLENWFAAARGLGRRLLEVLPGVGEKGK